MRGRFKGRGKYYSFILILLLLSILPVSTPMPVVVANPGYPVLEDITSTTYAGESTHIIDYPATVDPGDLLIAVFGCDDDENSVTFPNEGSEWYEIYFEDGGPQGPTLAVAWKEAVGNEDGGTFNIVTPSSEGSATYVFRISGMVDPDDQAPEVSSTASGASTNPNSLSLSPTGGSKEYLWISVEANDDDDDTSGYPANMGDNNQFAQVVTFTLGIATVTSTTDAFDPAQFTIAASESWEAVTIAVHPIPVANDAPVNLQASITDLDDTDDLYAQKMEYTLTYNVSDAQGFADIDYAEISIIQTAATRATFRYDEDTNIFSTQAGDSEWELNTGASSATESGNWVNMTFKFTAEWDATEEANLELKGYVVDDSPESDTDELQTDYFDVITNLLTSSIEFTDGDNPDRVNVGSSVTCDFSVRYANEPGSGTASAFYPPDGEFTSIAVYDEADATLGTDSSIVNGDGQITGTAKSTVETENYNLYVNMVDADYSDAEETATEQLISDNIEIVSVAFDDSRVDISAAAEVRYVLRYNYDDVQFDDGDGSIVGFVWDGGNTWWDKSITAPASPSADNYDENDLGALTDSNYGLTGYEDDAGSNIIGDQIVAYWEQLNDSRRAIGGPIEWRIKAVLDYDDEELGSGDSLTSSWGGLSWDAGNSWWEIEHTEGSVTGVTISLTAGSEAGFGITSFSENITETTGIYDQIVAYWEQLDDSRVDISTNIEWRIKAVLDYDDEELGSGDSLTSTWGGLSWDAGNSWWDIAHQEASVGAYTISLTAGSEAGYGISVFSENITESNGIFDQQQVQTLGANNTNPSEGEYITIWATVQSAYDSHVLGAGDSFTLKDSDANLYPMTYNGTYWENVTKEDAAVGRTLNTYDSVSEVSFSITVLDMDGNSVVITWGAANNVPVNDQASITNMDDNNNLYAQYTIYSIDYDGHDDDGYIDIDYVLVNLTQASTVRASFKYVNSTNTFSQIDGTTGYEIITGSCSASRAGNNLNLTITFKVKWGATEEADLELKAFIIDDEPQSDTDTLQTDYADAITDLVVSGFTADDDRGDLSQTLTFTGTVYYADNPSSGSPSDDYPPDAEFTSVDIQKADHSEEGADPSITDGAFSISFTAEATVGIETYHPYIDMVDADYSDADESPTDTFISDQIMVYWEQLNDTRRNMNAYIEGRFKAVLDYDESTLGSGDSLSSSWGALSWDGGNLWFEITHSESSVTGVTVSGWTGTEVTYSITSITENITETTWIYDRIQLLTLGANDTSPALDEVVEIYATAQSEYDSHVLGSGDELTLLDSDSNQYSMTYNGSHWLDTTSESSYVVKTLNNYYNVTEDTYSIDLLDMNSQSVTITWGSQSPQTNIGSPVMWRTNYLTLVTNIELRKPRLSEIISNKYALDVTVSLSLAEGYGPNQINLLMQLRDLNRSNHDYEDSFYLDIGEEITTTYSLPVKFTNGLFSTEKTRPVYTLDITAYKIGGEPLTVNYAEIPIPVKYGKMRTIPIMLVAIYIFYEIASYILSTER